MLNRYNVIMLNHYVLVYRNTVISQSSIILGYCNKILCHKQNTRPRSRPLKPADGQSRFQGCPGSLVSIAAAPLAPVKTKFKRSLV